MSKLIIGASSGIYQALYDAGVFKDDPDKVARVVIDLKAAEVAKVYVELYADESLIDVLLTGGLEVIERDAA